MENQEKTMQGREAQVRGELAHLEKSIIQMNERADALEGSLSEVLRSETAAPISEVDKAEEVLVPLANELRTARQRVELITNQLIEVSRRLEL
jgi:hypothetical protein